MTLIEQLAQSSSASASGLKVRSILNPMLWLCAIALPITLGFAWVFRGSNVISAVLVGAGMLVLLVTVGSYLYFAITAPSRLQSEEFQLKEQTLRVIETRVQNVNLDPATLAAIVGTPSLIEAGEEVTE